jgi:hypothetical protein
VAKRSTLLRLRTEEEAQLALMETSEAQREQRS